jgi:hypothetical protein
MALHGKSARLDLAFGFGLLGYPLFFCWLYSISERGEKSPIVGM